MIGRKRLSLQNDFPPLLRRCVEARHRQMQIRSQRLHYSDFSRLRTYEVGHVLLQIIVHVQPGRQVGILDFFEVAEDAFRRPCVEILLEVLLGEPWLQPERISTQVR